MMMGRIHSFQSLGTVDGPGIRAVVFMQGCPLRCICCHNPDTWDYGGGSEITVKELVKKISSLRSYFGSQGGVTVSGGEPLAQAEFVRELFCACKEIGINTALDTSGCLYNDSVERLLALTDLVLLDYKYMNSKDYEKNVGMKKERVDAFLQRLEELGKKVWLRQVVIPSVNDTPEAVAMLYDLKKRYSCIERIELLPFRKLCLEKYESMGIDFKLKDTPEASSELIERLMLLEK